MAEYHVQCLIFQIFTLRIIYNLTWLLFDTFIIQINILEVVHI